MQTSDIHAQTVIYLSKLKKLLWLLLYVPLVVFLSYMFIFVIKPELSFSYIFFAVMDLVFMYMIFDTIYSLIKNKPQFMISEEGMQLPAKGLDKWNTIWGEKFKMHEGKFKTPYLLYFSRGESRQFEMEGCDITVERLKELIRYYRSRYNSKNKDNTDNGVVWNMRDTLDDEDSL